MNAPSGSRSLDTASGRVRGETVVARDVEIGVFRGIPYAEAPVGHRRFAAPVPRSPWTGELDATRFGAVSMQPDSPMVLPDDVHSEDCLTLNVWAPSAAASSGAPGLPVMVWFHGGGFTAGSSSFPWYDGAHLASRGVVVVTVNYRLGPLGFLHLEPFGGEEFAGAANNGLADQTLSLRWVRDHIAAFGGDAERVTVFGESAGAISVSCHLAMPTSTGLFRRAIAQSGSASLVHPSEVGESVAQQVMDHLGVHRNNPAGLRDLPASAFVDVQPYVRPHDGAALPLPFGPTVDGQILRIDPLTAIEAGSAVGVDLIVGTNLDEMDLFIVLAQFMGQAEAVDSSLLQKLLTKAIASRGIESPVSEVVAVYRRRLGDVSEQAVWSAIASDLMFRVPAMAMADAQREHAEVRSYLYTHRSTGFGGLLGAAHSLEIPFVFENSTAYGVEILNGDLTPERTVFAEQLADAWTAFVINGDPATEALGEWPQYGDTRTTLELDLVSHLVDDPQPDERRIWLR